MLTDQEREVIKTLLQLTRETFYLLDDAETSGPVDAPVTTVERIHVDTVSDCLDVLDELPDDQPGYIMGPAAKAGWALRRILNTDSSS